MNFILCKSYFKKAVKRKEQCIGIGFINLSVIKLLEENKNLNLNDLGLGKRFVRYDPEKDDPQKFFKMYNFCCVKNTAKKMKKATAGINLLQHT